MVMICLRQSQFPCGLTLFRDAESMMVRAGSNSQLPCRHTFRTQVKLRLTTFQLPKIQAV